MPFIINRVNELDCVCNKKSLTVDYVFLSCLILLGFSAPSLKAEDAKISPPINFDTVVVSETKPPDDYPLNAPRDITRFNRQTIDELSFTRAQDTSVYVPNYNLTDVGLNGATDRSSIRGLANTPVYTTPSVIFYVDDVPYLSSFAYTNQLVSVDSIDVYRGPQGGLFGRNSYAGVINVKSRRPNNHMQGNVSVDYGNFNSLNINSYLSGALIKDQLYFSIGTAYSKRDGYLNNTFRDSKTDFLDHLSGNMSLIWTPNTSWEVNFSAYLQDFDDGAGRLTSLLSDNIYQTQSGDQGRQDQNANNQALKISYQNDHFKMLSVTTRRDADSAVNIDFDLLPESLVFLEADLAQKQWSQELRFKSLIESTWRWSAGLFFSNNAVNLDRIITVPQSFEKVHARVHDEASYAIFGQIGYQGFDALRIFLDLRLDYVGKEIDSNVRTLTGQTIQLKDQKSVVFASPKFSIEYVTSPRVSTYFSTGLAFKPGGFSPQTNIFPEFDKETMWNNEMGIKSSWLNDQLNTDLSLFYYDIKNYQLEEVFSPIDYAVINAPGVTSYGAELSFAAKITDTLKVNGNFGYNHIEFDDYIDPFSGEDFKGNKVPYAPAFNFNIAGVFKHPTGFYARTDFLWTGKTYFDAANSTALSEQDYSLLNIIFGYEYKHFKMKAYVNNLTKTEYFTSKIPGANVGIGTPGIPRIFGVRVSLKF